MTTNHQTATGQAAGTRIAGSLVFSGDWEYDAEAGVHVTGFTAARFGPSWNGFASPVVSHGVMRAFVDRLRELDADDPTAGYPVFEWDSARSSVRVSGEGYDPDVHLQPDGDRLYDLACLGWCFDAIESKPVRRLITDH
jgi:hypothetical protein